MKANTLIAIAILVGLNGCASNEQASYSPSESIDKQDNLAIMMSDIRRERGEQASPSFDETPYGSTATSGK